MKFDRSKLHEDIDYLLKDQLHHWTGSEAPFKLEKTELPTPAPVPAP